MSARLFMLIFIVCASTLAGVLVIAVLTLGMVDARSILIGAGLGAVLALPVSWVVARKLASL